MPSPFAGEGNATNRAYAMSDEAVFLEALTANPADDTVRLVYADWLDECDQPDKAQYLRAVTDLARLPGGTPEFTDAAERLYTACARTDESWRQTAGARFDVMLDGCGVNHKIHGIKIIREQCNLGLAQAKAMVESMPAALFSWLPFEAALPRLLAFHQRDWQGAVIPLALSIRSAPWPEATPGAVFDVLICALHPDRDYWSRYTAQYIAETLQIDLDQADERLQSLPLVVGSGLRPTEVAAFVRRLKLACNVGRPLPPDAIRIVPRVPATEACS